MPENRCWSLVLASLTVLRQVRMSSLATINYDSINANACFDLRSEMPNGNPKCNQAHTDIYIRTRYSMYIPRPCGKFLSVCCLWQKPIAPRSSPGACRPFTDIPKRRLPGGRYFSTGLDTTCAQEESPTPLRCHKSNESDVNLFWLDNSQLCKIVIHVEIMHCCPPESVHHIFRNKNMNQTPHNRPPLHLN